MSLKIVCSSMAKRSPGRLILKMFLVISQKCMSLILQSKQKHIVTATQKLEYITKRLLHLLTSLHEDVGIFVLCFFGHKWFSSQRYLHQIICLARMGKCENGCTQKNSNDRGLICAKGISRQFW